MLILKKDGGKMSKNSVTDMEFKAKQKILELYQRMIDENFMGEISLEDEWVIWRLDNGVIVKIAINYPVFEGYIATYFIEGKKEIQLTHWHPEIDEIFKDLLEINTGEVFWVRKKKCVFSNFPMIAYRKEWDKFSERKKNRYVVI